MPSSAASTKVLLLFTFGQCVRYTKIVSEIYSRSYALNVNGLKSGVYWDMCDLRFICIGKYMKSLFEIVISLQGQYFFLLNHNLIFCLYFELAAQNFKF